MYNYYDNDKLKQVNNADDTTSTYVYDAEGNLLSLVTKDSEGNIIDSFTYTYSDDTLGYKKQVSKTETVNGESKGTTNYEYDVQSRLTKATYPNGVQNVYTYDTVGNRLTKTSTSNGVSAVTEYTYDEQNRLLNTKAYVTGDTTETYTYYGYDNNGNQIARWTQIVNDSGENGSAAISELGVDSEDNTALYVYNNFNRLVGIYQGDDEIENTYDSTGKKITRTTNGIPVHYVYNGNTVILELDEEKDETARNVYGRNLISRYSDDTKLDFRYNGHGDVISLSDETETIVVYEYDEFGNQLSETIVSTTVTDVDNPYRYAGYEYLEEVDLYDLNARYYDPNTARFLAEDPYYNLGNRVMGQYEINTPNPYSIMQANALYAYCGNNPAVFRDSNGTWLHLIIGAVVGAAVSGVVSVAYQYRTTGKIDATKTIIAVAGGAVSGTLAASGAGLAAQVTGNAVIGATQSLAEQTYEISSDEYDRTEYDLIEIVWSATIGGVAGYAGGSANVSGISSISDQTVKRIGNAVQYHVANGSTNEITNALAYFYKSSHKLIGNEIIKGIIKAAGVDVANKIISETLIDDYIKDELYQLVNDYDT